MSEHQTKAAIVKRGEALLPKNLFDASAFSDLGKIQNIEFFNVCVHDPDARCQLTVNAKAIRSKECNNLRDNLRIFF